MAKLSVLALVVVVVMLESTYAACPTCTSSGSTCASLSSYIDCLKTVTTANGCTDIELTAAGLATTGAQTAKTALQCSGAGTVMASLGFALLLSCLVQYLSGNTH
ncbi:hypothetical protein Bpfe_029280 [Biomphalaria pfeifferi]|uniref:UPAR/Ly6 domain-containing protein n=1 Tax=Biomphalaria pfeifferi TaxID=112525 RepID=A0AAD8ARY1_BIOPF|nr:hypothetical protein Bpfe_029280 [Biomphalaria pfeifferi]